MKQYVKVCSIVPRKYVVFRSVNMNEILDRDTGCDNKNQPQSTVLSVSITPGEYDRVGLKCD